MLASLLKSSAHGFGGSSHRFMTPSVRSTMRSTHEGVKRAAAAFLQEEEESTTRPLLTFKDKEVAFGDEEMARLKQYLMSINPRVEEVAKEEKAAEEYLQSLAEDEEVAAVAEENPVTPSLVMEEEKKAEPASVASVAPLPAFLPEADEEMARLKTYLMSITPRVAVAATLKREAPSASAVFHIDSSAMSSTVVKEAAEFIKPKVEEAAAAPAESAPPRPPVRVAERRGALPP